MKSANFSVNCHRICFIENEGDEITYSVCFGAAGHSVLR